MPRRLILDSVRQRLHLLRLGGTLLPLLRPDTKLAEQLHIRIRFRVGRGQQLLAVENRVSTRHKTQRLHLLIHLLPPGGQAHMGGRHHDPGHRDNPNKLEGVQVVYILQWRALHFHQHIHRHTLRMLGQIRELNQQPYPVVFVFAHTHNAATAHLHAGLAHVIQGIQAILVGSGGDDVVVVLLGGIQVVVVVVQPGAGQLPGLFLFQHAQGHAGFHAQ